MCDRMTRLGLCVTAATLLVVAARQAMGKEETVLSSDVEAQLIENAKPFIDSTVENKGKRECHESFRQCMLSAIHIMDGEIDAAWIQGSSAFAFRIVMSETLCMSGTDWWDWRGIATKALDQLGYDCRYIDVGGEQLAKKMPELHKEIANSVNKGVPVFAYNAHKFCWSLIVGYDDNAKQYHTIVKGSESIPIAYDKIGRHILTRLTLVIPGKKTERKRADTIRRSLVTAVEHATGGEEHDAPVYQSGLKAFEQWATALDRGPKQNKDYERLSHQACIYYTARCYARDYLGAIKGDSPDLASAQVGYAQVADLLGEVWIAFPTRYPKAPSDNAVFVQAAKNVRAAGQAEAKAIEHIKDYLRKTASQ
jgi:hypothetical protein